MVTLITLLVLLGTFLPALARSADAQQVCYSYDALGRLTGVIDQNNQAAFYDYDAVGNILSIRRQSPSGQVTIYSFDPAGNAPGGSVEIFGTGFSSISNQNQVTIGGTSATVLSTLPCTLIVQVPGNAVTGPITVVTPQGQATSNSVFLVSGLVITGTAAAVLPNGTLQFTALTNGCGAPDRTGRRRGTPRVARRVVVPDDRGSRVDSANGARPPAANISAATRNTRRRARSQSK